MNIGIAAPIEINSLKSHFENLSDYDLSLGLGGTAINIIVDGFVKQGHNVVVFTLDSKVKKYYRLEGKNLKIIFGHFRPSAKVKMFDFCYHEIRQIKDFIRTETTDLDIINAHWSYEFAIGALLAKPQKTVVTFRDDAPSILRMLKHPYRITRLLMDRWVRARGRHFTYNSIYLRNLIKLEGEVIANPIFDKNIDDFRSHPGKGGIINIFFVANGTDSRKNPHIAIEAFKLLKQKTSYQVKMHFIGKGYSLEDDFALNYSKIEGIEFHGFVRHDSLLDMMKEFDIMLHTSKEESFGNNLIEAMAKGIPIVAGENSGAVPWVLNNGKAGVLVDITNVEDITKGLMSLVEDQKYYIEISKAGFQYVSEQFTQASVCFSYIKEYQKILNESASYI